MTGEETVENFIRINSQINQVEDKAIYRFLPELKKILNNDS